MANNVDLDLSFNSRDKSIEKTFKSIAPEILQVMQDKHSATIEQKIKEEKLGHLLGIENKVWLQVGENDRVFSFSQDNQEEKEETENSSNFFLSFELSNLMIKDLQSGITLFAGVEHPNYNVRTQEIPREISDSLTQSLHE